MTYMLRFILLVDPCAMFCLLPMFFIAFLVCFFHSFLLCFFFQIGIPTCVTFGIPLLVIQRRLLPLFDTSRSVDFTASEITIVLIKATIELSLFSMIAMIFSIGAISSALLLCIIYIALNVLKCTPPVSRILSIFHYASCVCGLLGLDNWREMLEMTKAKRESEMEDRQRDDDISDA